MGVDGIVWYSYTYLYNAMICVSILNAVFILLVIMVWINLTIDLVMDVHSKTLIDI